MIEEDCSSMFLEDRTRVQIRGRGTCGALVGVLTLFLRLGTVSSIVASDGPTRYFYKLQ